MKQWLGLLLTAVLLAACAAPGAQPAASNTQQVPVTGVTPAAATATSPAMTLPTAAPPTMAPTAALPVAATQVMSREPTGTMAMEPTAAMTMAATQMVPAATTMPAVTGGQTYTVLVGAMEEDSKAALEAFFPSVLHIHPGDTVNWIENGMEIHTVTFLAGAQTPEFVIPMPNAPQGAMMFNPLAAFPAVPPSGQYDGSTAAGSGIMGMEPGQAPRFSLTFTKPGTYDYICVVHAAMKMQGTIVVDDANTPVPSPAQASVQGQQELAALMAQVPAVEAAAKAQEQPDQTNADGTVTHHILVGYNQGQIDLMAFFPDEVDVKPGDTVVWTLSPSNMAPHTITFLNGAEEPPLVQSIAQPSGPPILTFDPGVALPQNVGQPLTNTGIYNSGVIDPAAPGPHSYTLKIGNLTDDAKFVCLLHDTEGMDGKLKVKD